MPASGKILEVKNLKTSFFTEDGEVKAVDDVSFDVFQGRTLGIVGESGCGKSVASLSIMRLIQEPPGRIVGGQILYKGRDLTKFSQDEMRKIRGKEISMIFQEPMTSLNPVYSIGNQIGEAIRLHQRSDVRSTSSRCDLPKSEIRNQTIEALKHVGIPSPEKRVDDFPHQLSGGMRQRVMIAMALSCNPNLLIADEPTTALDVTIQAQILDLLRDLQQKRGLGLILITHDLGVVAEMAEEVVVMYAGRVVEHAKVEEVFSNPKMPYTRALLNSIPKLNQRERLEAIPGIVPNLLRLPVGCRFQERCKYVIEECHKREPDLRSIPGKGPHEIRCLRDI